MQISQVYEIVNGATTQVTGQGNVVNEDLSNVVDLGNTIQNLDDWANKFLSALVDHIGRVVFVNRPYSGSAPSVLKDGGNTVPSWRKSLPGCLRLWRTRAGS